MPTADEVVPRAVAGAKAALAPTSGELPPVPEALRGKLQAAGASVLPVAPAEPVAPPRIGALLVRSDDDQVPLRTGPGVLRVLLKELAESRTLVQAQHAARVVKDRFLSTGVYNDVSVSAQEAVASNGAVRPDVADVVVGVRPRRTMALSVGGMQSLSGKLEGGTELTFFDVLGQAETIKLSATSSPGSLTGTDLLQAVSASTAPLLSGSGSAASQTAAKENLARTGHLMVPTPSFRALLSKPTLGSYAVPVTVQLRRELDSHAILSGFVNDLSEVEAHVTAPSGKHAVGVSVGVRTVNPLRHPTDAFNAASSQEVIDLSGTSLKSALTYAYVRNKLAPTDASVAPSGYKTMLRAELAGLGGDVSYVKVGVSHAQSWSFGRLAPDTGYQAPLSQSGFLARLRAPAAAAAAAAAASSSSTDSDGSSSSSSSPAPPQPLPVHGPDGRLLRAHPVNASLLPGECSSAALEAAAAPPAPIVTGPSLDPRAAASAFVDLVTSPSTGDGHGLLRHASDVFTAASVTSAVAPAAPPAAAAPVAAPALPARYGAWHRLAGWLSPGLTVAVDAGAGVLVPFGADACRPSRITDRFFLTSSKLRGFDAVGPRAAPVPEGSIQGDLLGGDVTAHVTARALLPPPLPSVRLANAGLRTQLWATAAHVGPSAQRAAQSLGRLSALPAGEAAAAVARGASFAAGVGVVLPLGPGLGVEANYALVHQAAASDLAASFRMQLMM